MKVMTSREFNQHLHQAQKAAQIAPVIITNRGEPAYVLMTYAEYTQKEKSAPFTTLLDLLADTDPACADIELELKPSSRAQRRPVDLED